MASQPGSHQATSDRLEVDVLGGVDDVVRLLDLALASLGNANDGYDRLVVPVSDQAAAFSRLHTRILDALTSATPASELRLVAALFHVTHSLARMREQCALLARLVPPLDERLARNDEIREQMGKVGELTRTQVARSRVAFQSRNVDLVDGLLRRDVEVKRAARKVFDRALDAGRDDRSRALSMLLMMTLNCLEELDDNAIEIGEQAQILSVFVR